MQRFKYLVAVLGLAAAAASAQPPGGPRGPGGPGGPPNMERLTVLLDLDTYQQGEVKRILDEQRATMQAARAQFAESGERPSFEEMQARREQNQQDVLTKLQSVLTEPQITKFKVLMERPEGRGGRRGPPPAAE
jgi:Heavy-metal resistance